MCHKIEYSSQNWVLCVTKLSIFHHKIKYFLSQNWVLCVSKVSILPSQNWVLCVTKLSIFHHKIEYCVSQNWVLCVTKLSIFCHKIEYCVSKLSTVSQNWVLCVTKLSIVCHKIEYCVSQNFCNLTDTSFLHCVLPEQYCANCVIVVFVAALLYTSCLSSFRWQWNRKQVSYLMRIKLNMKKEDFQQCWNRFLRTWILTEWQLSLVCTWRLCSWNAWCSYRKHPSTFCWLYCALNVAWGVTFSC